MSQPGAASVSSGSGSARSWTLLGHSDGSTATGSLVSHGLGSSDDNRNTRRRLDTFSSSEDEQARSAILLLFPCEQYRKGFTKWINSLWEDSNMPAFNKPVRIHCKAGSVSVRLVLKHKPDVKTLLLDIRMMVSPMELTVPSAAPVQLSLSANPDHLKTETSVNNLRPCGEDYQISSEFSSLMEMTKVHLSSQRSKTRSQVLSIKDRRNGIGKLCSNVSPLKADKLLLWSHLICLFLVFLLMCCNGFSLKPSRPKCDGRLFASSPFCRLAGRGAFFCGFPLRWVLYIVLSLTRRVNVHDATPCSREDSLYECGRPCDALSCLFFLSALWPQSNQSILVQETRSAKDD